MIPIVEENEVCARGGSQNCRLPSEEEQKRNPAPGRGRLNPKVPTLP